MGSVISLACWVGLSVPNILNRQTAPIKMVLGPCYADFDSNKHLHIHTHAHTRTYIHTRTHRTHTFYTHIHTHTYIHTHIHAHAHTHIYVRPYARTHMHANMRDAPRARTRTRTYIVGSHPLQGEQTWFDESKRRKSLPHAGPSLASAGNGHELVG
jgi:hypothetical protein